MWSVSFEKNREPGTYLKKASRFTQLRDYRCLYCMLFIHQFRQQGKCSPIKNATNCIVQALDLKLPRLYSGHEVLARLGVTLVQAVAVCIYRGSQV